jgi:hypothetical protein
VLDAAVERELDVRAIFWRHWLLAEYKPDLHFAGTDADRAMLAARGSRFLARWDQAHGRYCQHQKSWLIDAGEIGFVGGINLEVTSNVPVGHPPNGHGDLNNEMAAARKDSRNDAFFGSLGALGEYEVWPASRSASPLGAIRTSTSTRRSR